LKCNAGGKLAYFRAIRAFVNWLVRNDYLKDNPLKKVDAPKPPKPILPSLTVEQVSYLIEQVYSLTHKAIISLFADSGMRLSELANIKACDIDWTNHTITIWGKGNKQRKAPFTEKTARLLRELISQNGTGENIWRMKPKGIQNMLLELAKRTGLPCNPHTFRRTFASNLHRAGLDIEHIMRLGGWESLDMVVRYTRSVKFEDSLKLYRRLEALPTA
jgi:integrase/recombinase XerD